MQPTSAEIKITLTGDDVELALGRFPLPAQPKQWRIYFVEDVSPGVAPGTLLLDAGVVVRARVKAQGKDDSTIKLRPCRRSQLTNHWIQLADDDDSGFKIEADWAGTRRVLAASGTADQEQGRAERVSGGQEPASVLFTTEQKDLLATCSVVPVNLDAVMLLSPVAALRWDKFQEPAGDLTLDIRAERWTVDTLDFLELSIVAEIGAAASAQAAFEWLVRSRGFTIDVNQETKTRRVLEHLVQRSP